MTGAGAEAGEDASRAYLLGHLAALRLRVRAAVAAHRAADPLADDRFRGLYIPDEEVDRLLDRPPGGALAEPDRGAAGERVRLEARADAAEARGQEVRLRSVARAFHLDDRDRDLLVVALAPDVDPGFERLYAYLHDDVSRRRASTGLALRLAGASPAGADRGRLGPAGRLVATGLVGVEEADWPFLTRSLRVPDRVGGHVLGDDAAEPEVAGVECWPEPLDDARTAEVAAALRSGARLVYLREASGGAAPEVAAGAQRALGRRVLCVDLARLDPEAAGDLPAALGREAGLREATLVAGPVDGLGSAHPRVLRALAALDCPTVVHGTLPWDTSWSSRPPLVLEVAPLTASERSALWRAALDGAGADLPAVAVTAHVGHLRLGPRSIAEAAAVARQAAAAAARALTGADLVAGARSRNAGGLEHLARRVEPSRGWESLVLPAPVVAQLGELSARVVEQEQVLDRWGLGHRRPAGRGVSALFAGESGTGKTLSAEVVARALGLDLYVIDLATVVDKYIGETEKNLDRIFTEAHRVNGLLLFDEADALFGKRSEVRDAHDRYANVEVAYLLQRMERFEGVAVLTTNLRSNLDEAFTRRLDAVVDFPVPDTADRRRLWRLHLASPLPLAGDVDLDFMAGAFRMAGGSIANVALGAAFLAAAAGGPVTMAHLIRATEREYRKLGNLCLASEFGPYHHLVSAPAGP